MNRHLFPTSLLLICVFISDFGCQFSPKSGTGDSSSSRMRETDESDSFFADGHVLQLRIQLSESQEYRFREDLRKYVRCNLRVGDSTEFTEVAMKLKGAAGSFRELDDKPAFTFNMHKFHQGQKFHGMDKWHLNNSVQDESYLSEMLCAEICRAAGIPTPRVAHARVWLNDRDLGLYVLKEGFDELFLARHYPDPTGNLYDGGFLQDVDVDLEKDSGSGPSDARDLHALRDACLDSDPTQRWARMAELLDVDSFLKFMAFERMACHWDGYTLNKNNYRIYFEPSLNKAHFLPHGMDQMFGDPGFPLFDFPEPIVSGAVMQNPQWRSRYRETVRSMVKYFDETQLNRKLDEWQRRLTPVMKEFGSEMVQAHDDRVRELKERVSARFASFKEQLDAPDPQPDAFDESGRMIVADWYPVQETEDVMLEISTIDGRNTFGIAAGETGDCIASWRRRLLLAQGRYRVEARIRTVGVEPREDEQGVGAGLRISGANRENRLVGDNDWQNLQFQFDVLEPLRSVELVAELRAHRGQMWIDSEVVVEKFDRQDPESQ